MNFEPVDGTKLFLLMLAGAVFAAVGLYLLLRPKPEDTAKIEIFGLKFESSSAGLLVFVVGAGFLAVPLFVPEKTAPRTAAEIARPDGGTAPAGADAPADVDILEQEPNDRVQQATPLAFGATAAGVTTTDDPDWYVVTLPDPPVPRVAVLVRHVSGGAVVPEVFDGQERLLERSRVDSGAIYIMVEVGANTLLYVRIVNQGYPSESAYEVKFARALDD